MSKKTESVSFRTTEENLNYLKAVADRDDRSLSYVLNKLIGVFRKKGIALVRDDELL